MISHVSVEQPVIPSGSCRGILPVSESCHCCHLSEEHLLLHSSHQGTASLCYLTCELPVGCPHCNKKSLRVGAAGATLVEVALSCGSCGSELSRCFTSRKMATEENPTRQPFSINHCSEGEWLLRGSQTGLVWLTSLMYICDSLHHKSFTAISAMIQRKLYGVAAETLAE